MLEIILCETYRIFSRDSLPPPMAIGFQLSTVESSATIVKKSLTRTYNIQTRLRDLSEISRGGGGGNFKIGFGNEVTDPCNGSEIC